MKDVNKIIFHRYIIATYLISIIHIIKKDVNNTSVYTGISIMKYRLYALVMCKQYLVVTERRE